MVQTTVLLSSSLATLRSSSSSLLNNCVAVYPERSEGSHSSPFRTRFSLLIIILHVFSFSFAQTDSLPKADSSVKQQTRIAHSVVSLPPQYLAPQQKKNRQWFIGAVNVAGYGGTLIILNNTWYKNYARTDFHTFNDSREWLQVDKVGHAWTAYNAGRASAAMWKWAGVPEKKAIWIGGLSSMAFLTAIEFLDAHSAKWGWSWSDITANIAGSGLLIGQQLLWNEQRISYKFSFHKKTYGDPQLEQRADDLFGDSWYERMLKDYNAQSYWLSANLKSFFKKSNLPPWLNISVGYGADGMFGGFENIWLDDNGNEVNRTDIPRVRQFYLAPDIDFTRIKTNKKWLRTIFTLLNAFKCPAPAIMIDSKGKFKAYAIYF